MDNKIKKVISLIVFAVLFCNLHAGLNAKIKLGVEVLLEDQIHIVEGKKVGLITNPTGVTSNLVSTVDKFDQHPDVELVALFGPEHGVRGNVTAGGKIDDYYDQKTGVPVYSLYGATRKPTQEMLKDVEILVYDIQDIGSRSYTYIYTMAYAMEAAAEKGIPFVVLDRPNPLGGNLVEGPVLDPEFKSFVGLYPIPYVYGLTCGELAKLFNQEFDINCDLQVIKMKCWKRDMQFDDTGLEWIPTSPHIPHGRTAMYYPATGIIGELRTIDIGVGYTLPFELIGQTWIDADELAKELNTRELPGVHFRPMYYTPYYFANEKEHLKGVQIHILDFDKFQPVKSQIHILAALKKLYPDQKIFNKNRNKMFDKVAGSTEIRTSIQNGVSAQKIIEGWQAEKKQFEEMRKKYFLYE
ncbi:MAG TPA: DUF1343 domain-containing protein [bacterium]|nr:DUF1343 domain-containing protein [bacterium]